MGHGPRYGQTQGHVRSVIKTRRLNEKYFFLFSFADLVFFFYIQEGVFFDNTKNNLNIQFKKIT